MTSRLRIVPPACLLVLAAATSHAATSDASSSNAYDFPLFSASLGFDLTDGKYGGNTNTRIVEIPFRLRYETERQVFAVTLPYVEIRSERTAVITDGALVVGQTRTPQRISGMGDVVAAYTYKAAPFASGWYVDYTARVKFGTADADKGLGTGKNDYAFQFSLARDIGRFTPSFEAGYRFRGKSSELELRDSGYAAAGGRYRVDGRHHFELYYDYRQPATPDAPPQREVSLYYVYRPQRALRLELYVLKGYSATSPDRGAGLRVSRYF